MPPERATPTETVAPRLLLTPQEAADALGIHRATLYELLMSGEIPSISIGRARRIPLLALEAWIAAKLGVPEPPATIANAAHGRSARQRRGGK